LKNYKYENNKKLKLITEDHHCSTEGSHNKSIKSVKLNYYNIREYNKEMTENCPKANNY
jgi:hypothetical protein